MQSRARSRRQKRAPIHFSECNTRASYNRGMSRGFLLFTFTLGAIAYAEDWSRFRGPNGAGVSDSTGLPVEFGPQQNVVWKTTVPFGRSSPVIAGDHIFLTASEKGKLITLCLDRATGKIQWR